MRSELDGIHNMRFSRCIHKIDLFWVVQNSVSSILAFKIYLGVKSIGLKTL
jgi:hypothetical protein